MLKKEELFGKTIAELASEFNWSKSWSKEIIMFANGWVYLREKDRAELDNLKKKTTLRDVVKKLEFEFYNTGGRHTFFKGGYGAIHNALMSLGLTRLDSIAIPQKTVTVEMLKQLTKDELLAMSACVLGTMSIISLVNYGKIINFINRGVEEERVLLPTVAEILTVKTCPEWSHFQNKAMIYRTVILLRELGFTDDDGPFMQIADDTKKNVEKIMKQEAVDEKTAKMIVEMAQRRGWKI